MSMDDSQGTEALGADGVSPDGSPIAQPHGDAALPPPEPIDGISVSNAYDPDNPVLVGVAFGSRLMAQEYLMAMSRLRSDGALQLKDAVIVEKREDGHVKVTETIDPTPGKSAISGAMWTGLLGLLVGGPVGWLAGIGIGAGAGAITAKVVDIGIPDEWVDWFKLAVREGESAVIILADHVDLHALQREAHRFPGAELIESTLPPAAITDLAAAFDEA